MYELGLNKSCFIRIFGGNRGAQNIVVKHHFVQDSISSGLCSKKKKEKKG